VRFAAAVFARRADTSVPAEVGQDVSSADPELTIWSPGSISCHNHVKILGIEIFVVGLVK
jgi:hypothetical protein